LAATPVLLCAAGLYLQHAAAQTRRSATANQSQEGFSSGQVANATHSMGKGAGEQNGVDQLTLAGAGAMVMFPVSNLHPGGVSVAPKIPNPVANDPDAVNRGMRFFATLNCVGCHAPNGGGGMGPSLSNRVFIYGSDPAQIYLSISQGRPHGMPSWGAMLPPSVIWDLVAYVHSISQASQTEWGQTISVTSPSVEQVPAEYQLSTDPWAHTQPFGHGQNPEGRKQ
jgi:cytochrome c oxidase cbb3-type subunit 3